MMRGTFRPVLVLAAMVAAGSALAAPVKQDRPAFRPGEVIVKFSGRAPQVGMQSMQSMAVRAHASAQVAKTMADVGRPGTALVRFAPTVSVDQMVAAFRALPGVEYAEPNYLAYIPEYVGRHDVSPLRGVRGKDGHATVNKAAAANPRLASMIERATESATGAYVTDPSVGKQDGWYWIGANIIWSDKVGNPVVAVLDTGVDYLHPDLTGRVLKGKDWINADADPMDDNGHGTHVAGAIAAAVSNAKGIAGVTSGKVLAIKVLDSEGSGTYFDIAKGIDDAAINTSVKVINMSLGGGSSSATLLTAITNAVTRGKLIVAAAGNSGNTTPHYPAYYAFDPAVTQAVRDQTIAVAASGEVNYVGTCPGSSPACTYFIDYSCMAGYSTHGDWISVSAPGTAMYSTTPTKEFWLNFYYGIAKNYDYLDGTSMATPLVSGTAARVLGAMPAGTTAAQVKARIVATGATAVANGQGTFIDTDGDGVTDAECWPAAAAATATDVNVAAAMYRANLYGRVLDPNGALPLIGAQVSPWAGTVAKGRGGYVEAGTSPYYDIINVPMNASTNYTMKVNKAGYTAGTQKFSSLLVDDCGAGNSTGDCLYAAVENVSVPKNVGGVWHVVTDWNDPTSLTEIDQYLYTPSSATVQCGIGYYGLCGSGSLAVAPFARWLHDGGPFSGSGSVEYTAIKSPLYATTTGSPYEIFLTDYADSASIVDPMINVTTRLWNGGSVKGTVLASAGDTATHTCSIDPSVGPTNCDIFYVGDLSGTGVFTPRGIYGVFNTVAGDPDGVLPYSVRDRQRVKLGAPATTTPTGRRKH
jgi:thermitase